MNSNEQKKVSATRKDTDHVKTSFLSRLVEKSMPEAAGAAQQANEVFQRLGDLVEPVEELIGVLQSTAQGASVTSESVTRVMNRVEDILSATTSAASLGICIADVTSWLVDVGIAILHKTYASIVTLTYRFFRLIGVAENLIDHLVGMVARLFSPQESNHGEVERQSGSSIIATLSSICGTVILSRVPSSAELRSVNDKFRFMQNVRTEGQGMWNTLLEIAKYIPDVVQQWLLRRMPLEWWMKVFSPGSPYYEWMKGVEILDTMEIRDRATYDVELQRVIRTLHEEGKEHLRKLALEGPQAQKVLSIMQPIVKLAADLFKIVDRSGNAAPRRKEPFVVYLCGAPGQGKSFLSGVIPYILAGVDADTPNMSYSRNPGIDHWDGYTGQYAVVYDDYGSTRMANAKPGEYAEMLSIVSNEQYRLPMAALGEKGDVFRSSVVICTSNTAFPAPNELTNHTALWRRRHFMYRVSVDRARDLNGYRYLRDDGVQVDPAKVPADNSHLRFEKYMNVNDPQARLENPIGYAEFVLRLKNAFRVHQDGQVIALQRQEEMMHGALERQVGSADSYETTVPQFEYATENTRFLDGYLEALATNEDDRSFSERSTLVAQMLTRVREVVFVEEAPMSRVLQFLSRHLKMWGVLGALLGTFFGMRRVWKNRTKEVETEGNPIRDAVMHFKGHIPDAELEKILVKYAPEAERSFGAKVVRGLACYNQLVDEDAQLATEFLVDVVRDCVVEKGRVVTTSTFVNLQSNVADIVREGVYGGTPGGKIVRPTVVRVEGARDPNCMEVVHSCVYPNLVRLVSDDSSAMHGVFVSGRLLLTNYHFYCDREGNVRDQTVFTIFANEVKFQECALKSKVMRIGNSDLALFLCSSNVRAFRNILHLFMQDTDLVYKQRTNAFLVTTRSGSNLLNPIVVQKVTTPVGYWLGEGHSTVVAGDERRVLLLQSLQYDVDSEKGMCGSPVVMNDTALARKIAGIHCAGDKGFGVAIPVTQDMLLPFVEKMKSIVDAAPAHLGLNTVEIERHAAILPEGNFSIVGTLKKPVFMSTKTKLMPSDIQGMLRAPTTFPAVLTPKDPRLKIPGSPLKRGIEKYGRIACRVDAAILERVRTHLLEVFRSFPCSVSKNVVTTNQAINGLPGVEYAECIDMTTSAGYPYNQRARIPGKGGKSFLFERRPLGWVMDDRELIQRVQEREEVAKQGRRVPSYWIDTLKDERRPLDKIEKGKTRVFTLPPVDYSIVFRKYFLAFSVHFYDIRLKTFSAVGINPESLEWTRLYYRMLETGDTVFAGDYSGWDGNLSPAFLMACCEIVNDWYDDGEENAVVRRVLFDEIIHTMQVAVNVVYMTHLGNPSGNPATIIINTILNAMYLRYVWLRLAPAEYRSLALYEEHVRDCIVGDDNVVSPSEEVASFFEPNAVTAELALLHLDYTAASKDGAAHFSRMREVTFLKRGFRVVGNYVLPLMAEDTIYEMINWVRKSDFDTPQEMLISNCNEALRFAFFYGFFFFDDIRRKLSKAMPLNCVKLLDWKYFHDWFYEENMNQQNFVNKLKDLTVEVERQSGANNIERIENAKGITSLSQRKADIDDGSYGKATTSKVLADFAIGDPEWKLPEMVKRRVWYDTKAWNTTDTFQTNVWTLECPKDIIVNYLQSANFERFTYWTGTMRFIVHANGTRFHQGRLIAFFVPFTKKDQAVAWHGKNMAAAWTVPNVFVDASSSNEAILEVPFYNPNSYVTLNGPYDEYQDYVGTFVVQVLTPLAAATGTSAKIDVSLWVEFGEDSKFRVPMHSGSTGVWHPPEYVREVARQGNSISNVTSVSNYGTVDGMSIPTEMTGDSIGNGNAVSGLPMDKPARTFNPLPVFRKAFQNISNTVGSELVDRLDLNPSNQNMSLPAHFATERDEMDMSVLLHHPTYAETLTWSSDDAPGKALTSRFIGPFSYLFSSGTADQITLTAGTPLQMTLWEYNCLPFLFWRGGVRIRLDFVATQMHTGRLFLSLNYGAAPGSETGLRDATSQYGQEIELSNENRTFIFDIPQNSRQPWLKMAHGPYSNITEFQSNFFQNHFYGSWSLRVLNQLAVPVNAPSSVSIIVSVCGSPGNGGVEPFEVYYPGMLNQEFWPTYVPALFNPPVEQVRELEREGKDDDVLGGNSVVQITNKTDDTASGTDAAGVPPAATLSPSELIAPVGYSINHPTIHFGKKASVKHVAEMIKRYVPYPFSTLGTLGGSGYEKPFNLEAETAEEYWVEKLSNQGWTWMYRDDSSDASLAIGLWYATIPVLPALRPSSTYPQAASRSMLPFYAAQYRFWRGSMRYKCLFNQLKDFMGVNLEWSKFGAVYLPGTYVFRATSPNSAQLARMAASSLFAVNPEDVVARGAINTGAMYFPVAADVATDAVPYCEVEIPFTTHHNVHINMNGVDKDGLDYPDYTSVGYLCFLGMFEIYGTSDYLSKLELNGLALPPAVWNAAGDDMRYGGLLGPTNIVPGIVANDFDNNGFDTWVVSAPAAVKEVERQSGGFPDGFRVTLLVALANARDKDSRVDSGQLQARSALNEFNQQCLEHTMIGERETSVGQPPDVIWTVVVTWQGNDILTDLEGGASADEKRRARELGARILLKQTVKRLSDITSRTPALVPDIAREIQISYREAEEGDYQEEVESLRRDFLQAHSVLDDIRGNGTLKRRLEDLSSEKLKAKLKVRTVDLDDGTSVVYQRLVVTLGKHVKERIYLRDGVKDKNLETAYRSVFLRFFLWAQGNRFGVLRMEDVAL